MPETPGPYESHESCAGMRNSLSFRVDRQGLTGLALGKGIKKQFSWAAGGGRMGLPGSGRALIRSL